MRGDTASVRWQLGAVFLAAAGVALLIANAASAQDLKQLNRTARESVVQLKVYRSDGQGAQGTGFAVHGGLIVTNYHVIERATKVEAILATDEVFTAVGVLGSDKENDLAVLRLDYAELPPLPLAGDITIEPGERVVVLGSPLGLSGTLSEGIVSAVREPGETEDRDSPQLLQITAAISGGSSGSPVMTLEGKVIGVVVSYRVGGQNLNFAVPVTAVAALLDKIDPRQLEKPLARTGTAGSLTYVWNLAISLLIFAAIIFGLRRLRV